VAKVKRKSKLAKRYQAVYDELYTELPQWKKQALEENHDRISTEFAHEVAKLAEEDLLTEEE
jgi:hypothetical protein